MNEICQVCDQLGHGNHFGVKTCRACAAFFRRSVVQGRKYTCRKGSRNCEVVGKGKFVCRYCRYQKCVLIGMTPENVQWNRDVLSTTIDRGRPESSGTTTTEGSESEVQSASVNNEARTNTMVTSSDMTHSDADIRITFDVSHAMDKLREIFSQDQQKSDERCLLLHMYRGLERHRCNKNPTVELVDSINFLQKLSTWEIQFLKVAKWMMNCEYFAALPLEEKVVVFKGSWGLWKRFERMHMSVHLFGEHAIHERMILLGENTAANMDTVRMEFGPLTDCDPQQIKSMFEDCVKRLIEDVARPLLELNLDHYEVSYILNALVWHVEGRDVRPSTRSIAEEVLDRISDELHDHYTYDLRMPNYAARLTRIMGLIFSIERDQHERSKVVELARVFDVFKFEVSEKGVLNY
ncbi:hypothetical protein RB195_014378 [Necator americanus]